GKLRSPRDDFLRILRQSQRGNVITFCREARNLRQCMVVCPADASAPPQVKNAPSHRHGSEKSCRDKPAPGRMRGKTLPDLLPVRAEVRDMWIALLRLLGQGLLKNALELSWQACTKLAQVPGFLRQDSRQHFEAGISGKGASAGKHFIEHRAEAEDI